MMSIIQLPPPISGPSAWWGSDMAHPDDWIEPLSSAEIAEIEAASRQLTHKKVDWLAASPEDFPLPALKRRLNRIIDEVLNGRGFVLLRGLPVGEWDRQVAATAFLGLGLHWGRLRPQNVQGHLLGHVKDM